MSNKNSCLCNKRCCFINISTFYNVLPNHLLLTSTLIRSTNHASPLHPFLPICLKIQLIAILTLKINYNFNRRPKLARPKSLNQFKLVNRNSKTQFCSTTLTTHYNFKTAIQKEIIFCPDQSHP